MVVKSRVLIVDDDPGLRKTLSDVLEMKGYAVVAVGTGQAALERVKEEAPVVALIDLNLEDTPGLEVLKEIKRRSADTECIVLTGYASQESAIEVVNLGAYGYVQKPYDIEQLLLTIRRAVEKREADEEARYQKKYFLALFENSPEAVVSFDMESRVRDVNPAFEKLFGYSLEDVKGRDLFDFIIPERKREESARIRREAREGTSFVADTVRKRVDGREIPVSILGAPIVLDGKQVGIFGIFRDITQRKRAEEALRESEEFGSSLLANSPNPILVSNADTSIRYVNPALEELSGFSAAELIGVKAPYPWWTKETLEKTSADFAEGMSKGTQKREELFQKKSGERYWVEITAGPIMSGGKLKHYVANWVDITERKEAQERLEDAFIDLAETVSRAMGVRDPFTSGHERRVAELARLVAEKMGVNGDRLYGLYIGALLHDIGKISIPASILNRAS
ncbi:MAG: PAS domain S-box protein [Dehalococcoidia bacterium]|nr:PAS domain S-box protein [Dehalococcoidia bacterium]